MQIRRHAPIYIMKRFLKWTGWTLAGLLGLALITLGLLYVHLHQTLNTRHQVHPVSLAVPEQDTTLVAHGKRVAQRFGCTDCHADNLAGARFFDNWLLGTVASANLTPGPGGVGATYTTRDWIRAIRHGLNPDQRPLLIMPATQLAAMGRQDLVALLAFLKQLEPVAHHLPPRKIGPLLPVVAHLSGLTLVEAGTQPPRIALSETPPAGPTPAYGAYLAVACRSCHGKDLSGVRTPGQQVPGLNTLQGWTDADFARAVREGLRPNGDTLSRAMPRWTSFSQVELQALWAHVQTLQPPLTP